MSSLYLLNKPCEKPKENSTKTFKKGFIKILVPKTKYKRSSRTPF